MTDDSNIGTMLAVAGLFAITFYLLRDPVGDAESAIIAAAVPCAGLTGATLAACKKAQPKPKPAGITAAKPKPVVKPKAYGQAGTGGMVKKPIRIGTRVVQGKLVPAPGTYTYGRVIPGATHRFSTSVADRCIVAAENYYNKLKSQVLSNLARQRGYRSTQEMFSSYNNDRSTRGMAYITVERYENAKKDAVKNCILRYSSPQLGKEFSEFGNNLRAEPEVKAI